MNEEARRKRRDKSRTRAKRRRWQKKRALSNFRQLCVVLIPVVILVLVIRWERGLFAERHVVRGQGSQQSGDLGVRYERPGELEFPATLSMIRDEYRLSPASQYRTVSAELAVECWPGDVTARVEVVIDARVRRPTKPLLEDDPIAIRTSSVDRDSVRRERFGRERFGRDMVVRFDASGNAIIRAGVASVDDDADAALWWRVTTTESESDGVIVQQATANLRNFVAQARAGRVLRVTHRTADFHAEELRFRFRLDGLAATQRKACRRAYEIADEAN